MTQPDHSFLESEFVEQESITLCGEEAIVLPTELVIHTSNNTHRVEVTSDGIGAPLNLLFLHVGRQSGVANWKVETPGGVVPFLKLFGREIRVAVDREEQQRLNYEASFAEWPIILNTDQGPIKWGFDGHQEFVIGAPKVLLKSVPAFTIAGKKVGRKKIESMLRQLCPQYDQLLTEMAEQKRLYAERKAKYEENEQMTKACVAIGSTKPGTWIYHTVVIYVAADNGLWKKSEVVHQATTLKKIKRLAEDVARERNLPLLPDVRHNDKVDYQAMVGITTI
jgi:hypothetical protein